MNSGSYVGATALTSTAAGPVPVLEAGVEQAVLGKIPFDAGTIGRFTVAQLGIGNVDIARIDNHARSPTDDGVRNGRWASSRVRICPVAISVSMNSSGS